MMHIFQNKRISSILTVLPDKVVRYEDELEEYPFPVRQSQMLGKMMGYDTRRQCEPEDCLSEYALYGINYLLEKGILVKNDIDAILVVSSSQDYIMPSVSYIIQGRLGLSEDVYCCDIMQACGGYQFGLAQSFMLIDTYGYKKVVLVNGEMLTKKIGKRDRNARPIIGDGVAVSIIEPSNNGNVYYTSKNYGQLSDAIKIPAGGLKMPSNSETVIETKDEQGNFRSLDDFYMDGEAVFNFVMTKVPPMIDEILCTSGYSNDSIDFFMFHQPNKYMVDRLIDEMDIKAEKCPDNIVGLYGNASTATVPINICHNIASDVKKKEVVICLSGFGGGLTCNAIVMKNPPMEYCGIIDYKH